MTEEAASSPPVVLVKKKKKTPVAGVPGPGRKKGSKMHMLSPKAWAEAEALWASGEVTAKELAAKFGCVYETILRHMSVKGIAKGSRAAAIAASVAKKVEKKIEGDTDVTAQRIRDTKDHHYKMAETLSKLTFKEVLDARSAGHALGSIYANLKSLETAMRTIKMGREERFSVLGLDRADAVDMNDIPELVIEELTADEVEALRAAREQDVETVPVVPVVSAEVEPEDDDGIESEGDD